MKRLLLVLGLLLMTATPAMAHGHFFFGLNIGIPLYNSYPVSYYAPPPVYYPPAYYYPPAPVVIQSPYGYVIDRRVPYYGYGPYYNRYNGYGNRYYGRPVIVR